MSAPPLVSTVITTYNRASMVVGAIESALSQTWENQEVIVVDDGSTDDTIERLQPYQDNIRLIRQENQGAGPAKNTAMEAAQGKYLAFLDSDDRWKQEKLEIQVAFMESRSECAGCVVPWAVSTCPELPVFDKEALCTEDGIIERPIRRLYRKLFWIPSAAMARRSVAKEAHFGTERGASDDHIFNLGLFTRGPVGVAGTEIQMIYHLHDDSLSSTTDFQGMRGVRRIRELDWTDLLGNPSAQQLDDLHTFLSDKARSALIRLLMSGEKGQSASFFLEETPHLLQNGNAPFALAFPVFWMLPRRAAQWYWRDELGAQESHAH